MRLRLFVDLEYCDPVDKTTESVIQSDLADTIHEMAREHKFDAGGRAALTVATASSRIDTP